LKNAWQRLWLFLPLVGLTLAVGIFSPTDARAAPRKEQGREYAGDLGAMVQHDNDGRTAGTLFRVCVQNASIL